MDTDKLLLTLVMHSTAHSNAWNTESLWVNKRPGITVPSMTFIIFLHLFKNRCITVNNSVEVSLSVAEFLSTIHTQHPNVLHYVVSMYNEVEARLRCTYTSDSVRIVKTSKIYNKNIRVNQFKRVTDVYNKTDSACSRCSLLKNVPVLLAMASSTTL